MGAKGWASLLRLGIVRLRRYVLYLDSLNHIAALLVLILELLQSPVQLGFGNLVALSRVSANNQLPRRNAYSICKHL